jgi:septal ring factor EnvC (AmiA/AmiB activator)
MLLILSLPAFPQTKKELEKKKAAIEKEIENTNKLLNQTKKNKASTLNQVVMLNKKISYRSELIHTVNQQIDEVDDEIGTTTHNIDSLEQRMTDLKKYYAQMLYFAYKNQSAYSRLTFIFSATDFNQAYKRMKYMQQLSAYRLHQRDLIQQTQADLSTKKKDLQGVKTDKLQLLTKQEREKANLDKEKKEQVVMVKNLSKTEKKLKANLADKQRAAAKLDRMIEDVIRKEIEAAKAAAKKRSSSTLTADAKKTNITSTSAVLAMTPEAMKLSNDFENNRGKLPWPVEQGYISSSYGKHAHPIWKEVVVNNSGIDINSQRDAKVRAIFSGRVTKVILIVNKYAVIIQHGEYFTVYSNLKEVSVKSDDLVKTKQVIGKVETDEDDGKSEVHLEVWKGSNKMDPEGWIASR